MEGSQNIYGKRNLQKKCKRKLGETYKKCLQKPYDSTQADLQMNQTHMQQLFGFSLTKNIHIVPKTTSDN